MRITKKLIGHVASNWQNLIFRIRAVCVCVAHGINIIVLIANNGAIACDREVGMLWNGGGWWIGADWKHGIVFYGFALPFVVIVMCTHWLMNIRVTGLQTMRLVLPPHHSSHASIRIESQTWHWKCESSQFTRLCSKSTEVWVFN